MSLLIDVRHPGLKSDPRGVLAAGRPAACAGSARGRVDRAPGARNRA